MANRVRFVDNVGVSAFGSTAGNDALTNASASLNNIIFTKGDNSQFTITVDTGSGGGFFNTSSLMITASIAGSDLTFTKGDGSTFTVILPSSSANTGSLLTTGSVAGNTLTFTKGDGTTFDLTVAGGGSGGNGIFTKIGSTDQFQATSSLKISGSTLFSTPLAHSTNLTSSDGAAKYALVVSESVWHRNANVGVPTTNPWKTNLEGTFFNRFDHNTDIAEMLRYMVGVLSGSSIGPDFADTSPNSKFWNSVSTAYSGQSTTSKSSLFNGILGTNYENGRLSQHWTSSAFIDFSKTASYREAQQYYIAKGFTLESDRGTFGNDTGTNPFHGSYASRIPSTIIQASQFASLSVASTANAGGSSTVFSNSNYFGMGELTSGNATPYTVRIQASQSYLDTYSGSPNPSAAPTFTTSSTIDYTISDFGSTAQGLALGKINPPSAELPAAFQDGRFVSTPGSITGRKYTGGATSNTTISSSGYYEMHDVKSGLQTSSGAFNFKDNTDSSILFYTPNPYQGSFTSAGALQDITNSQPSAVVSNVNLVRTAFTATSRSLSGAPYLLTTTYAFTLSSEVSKSFDPVYGANYNGSNTPLAHSKTDNWSSFGSVSFSPTSVSVTNAGVQTTGGTGGVLSADKSTQRSNGNIPHIDDISFLSSSYSFSLNTIYSSTDLSTRTLTFTSTGQNFRGTDVTSNSSPQNLYDATLFNQTSASGSLQIYTRAQGYDNGSLTGTSEQFTGETYRLKINDNLLNGTYATADRFVTSSFTINNLTSKDLQIVPGTSQGSLIKPGEGYWLSTLSSDGYGYYARVFDTNVDSQQSNLFVDVGDANIVHWNDTTSDNAVAVAVLQQSCTATNLDSRLGGSNNPRFFDIKNIVGGSNNTYTANTTGTNPFGISIDVNLNNDDNSSAQSGISGNSKFKIPLISAKGMLINGSFKQVIVLIRYKGNPSSVSRINLTVE